MDLSHIVRQPSDLKILGFTVGIILEMMGSDWGFFPELFNLEKN
jgi:hypothetical protein